MDTDGTTGLLKWIFCEGSGALVRRDVDGIGEFRPPLTWFQLLSAMALKGLPDEEGLTLAPIPRAVVEDLALAFEDDDSMC